MKESILIGSVIMLMMFNGFYAVMNPGTEYQMAIGTVLGVVISVLGVGLLTGVQVAGSGISDTAQKLILVIALVLNLLIRIDIPAGSWQSLGAVSSVLGLIFGPTFTFSIGLGSLYPNAYNVFIAGGTDNWLGYFGFLTITIIAVAVLVSGLLTALE